MKPAARITDPVVHPLPPVLTPGPGSFNTLIGMLPAWRGVPAAVAASLQAAKQVSETVIKAAEAATVAAAGTPGAPAAKAAEEATKASAAASMGSAISAAAGMADIHLCTTPLPIPPHGPGVVIDGRQTVLINNLPACCLGDTILEAIGPPNKIAMGCPTVIIGDSNSAGSVSGPSGGGGGVPGGGGATPGGTTPTPEPPATIAGMTVSVLPNGDVKVGNAIVITGSLEFKTKTLVALGQIASTPTGEALLQSIDKNGKTVTIQETSQGNACGYSNGAGRFQNADGTPGAGTDATVSYNPDRTSIGDEEWETRPPAIGLAHELVHADQAGKGVMQSGNDNNDHKPDPTDPTKTAQEKKRELEAAGIPPYDTYPYNENKIREEWPPPQPERKWY
jgi:hypothetical protein